MSASEKQEVSHVTRVEPVGGKYQGTCSCGKWKTDPMSYRKAQIASWAHREANK